MKISLPTSGLVGGQVRSVDKGEGGGEGNLVEKIKLFRNIIRELEIPKCKEGSPLQLAHGRRSPALSLGWRDVAEDCARPARGASGAPIWPRSQLLPQKPPFSCIIHAIALDPRKIKQPKM